MDKITTITLKSVAIGLIVVISFHHPRLIYLINAYTHNFQAVPIAFKIMIHNE